MSYRGRGGGGRGGGYGAGRGNDGDGYRGRGGGQMGGGDRGGQRRFESNRGGRGGGRGGGGGGRQFEGPPQTFPETERQPVIAKNIFPTGTSGRSVDLVANYFKVNVGEIIVYKHDFNIALAETREVSGDGAAIDNERMQKFLSTAVPHVFEIFRKQNDNIFHDVPYIYDNGNNFYSIKNLAPKFNTAQNIQVEMNGRTKRFVVKINMVETIDLSAIHQYYREQSTSEIHQVVVHFMESLFRQLSSHKYAVHNRNFFDANAPIRGTYNWINFVRGFTNACKITEVGLTLNIHLKTCSMISASVDRLEPLVLMITQSNGIGELRPGQLQTVNKIIKGLKVFTTHCGRKSVYTIKGLSQKKPKDCAFEVKDASGKVKNTNVFEYFKEKYKITLKNYPVVSVVGRNNLCIPLELCQMIDKQFLNTTKLDASIQNDLLSAATHKPVSYFANLTNYTNEMLKLNPKLLANFGTDFSPKPLTFTGRVLDAPRQLSAGRNDPFYRVSVARPKWAFISLDRNFNNQEIDRFVQDLQRSGQRCGINFGDCCQKRQVPLQGDEFAVVVDFFTKLQAIGCQIIFVVLPPGGESLYGYVKHLGDQKFGIVTQCLNGSKALNRRGGYVENILLKVNGKLGGKNSAVHEDQYKQIPLNHSKTMVIGVDVNHPGQFEKVESSIAAAVGSYDSQFTLYSVSLRVLEENRQEFIDKIGDMIEELLLAYRKVNGYFPETLVVFRDGVASGQFPFAEKEIQDIRKSYRKNVKNGKIIYIAMQKGHNTRFVLARPSEHFGRPTQNVPSGTIVDNTIIEPSQNMFFLNSHFSQLGTSKPMKYVVLYNEFEQRVLSADALQKFCFFCCHGCTRFRGPIALPVPIRYADLCAYRSKIHLETAIHKTRLADLKVDQKTLEQKVIQKLNILVKLNEKIKNSLYYA